MNIRKIKPNELFFWISYYVYISISILYNTVLLKYIDPIYSYVKIFCLVNLIMCEIFYNKWKLKTALSLLVASVLIVLSMKINQSSVMMTIAFIYFGRTVDFKKIAKKTIILTSILLFTVIFLAKIGVLINYVGTISGRTRNYLGFRYALYAPAFFTNIVMLICYIKKEKFKIFNAVIIILVDLFLYYETKSRLSFVATILVVICTLISSKKKNNILNNKIIRKIMKNSYIIFGLATIVLTMIYVYWPNQIISTINRIMMGRISMNSKALKVYGLNMFPRTVRMVGAGLNANGETIISSNNYFYIDSLYIKFLVQYGIVFTFLIIFLLTLTCYFYR